MATWDLFPPQVDEDETDKAVLAAAAKFFVAANLKDPQAADGARIGLLEKRGDFPTDAGVQAFIVRTLRTLEAVKLTAKASKLTKASEPSIQSALGLAHQLAPTKKADTEKILLDAHLDTLPFVMQVEQPVIDNLWEETAAAKSAVRPAFIFIDLTASQVTPPGSCRRQVSSRCRGRLGRLRID